MSPDGSAARLSKLHVRGAPLSSYTTARSTRPDSRPASAVVHEQGKEREERLESLFAVSSLRQREGGVRGREGQGVSANAMPCARDRSFILPASYASAVPCSRREEGRPAALVSTLLRGNEDGWKVGRVLR